MSNVRWAETQDFSLIKLNHSMQPHAPFIVTVGKDDAKRASSALQHGSLGLILKPVDSTQSTVCIRVALWLFQLRATAERRMRTLEKLYEERQTLSSPPKNAEQAKVFEKGLLSMEKTFKSFEKTIEALEKSLQLLNNTVFELETQARQRAVEYLKELSLPFP